MNPHINQLSKFRLFHWLSWYVNESNSIE